VIDFASFPSREQWQRIGTHKRSGVLVPLFSVHSKNSAGIGDSSDLKLIIKWARLTGNSIIQLLPLNELGGVNCPYDSVSSFALEPAYISLKDIPGFKPAALRLNPDPGEFVDYAIRKEKLRILWEIFLPLDLSEAEEFEQFQKDNVYWLMDFALFKVLKDLHQGRPWYEWPEEFKSHNRKALDCFRYEHIEAVTFQMWLQWVLFKQFCGVKIEAGKNKVLLKGDLPILVSRDSADVWSHPEFFKLDFASGAPPDMYCAKGQRWGMPTYNWQNIAADSYRYIKEKLKYAENFYDILRVDHVVGLFRIWSIPYNEPAENRGLNGTFDPREESLWREHGRNILDILIKNTKMLLCAEDLGVIPKACPEALKEFGIPGNDVQRWVKDWDKRHDFIPPEEFRELAVATLSTHDTTNFKAWWQYEAGTVDEGLFVRKCNERGIDFARVKPELFDLTRSFHGRLRWKEEVDTVEKLTWILGRKKEDVGDFIDLYLNSYLEKEKLWALLGYIKPLEEEASDELLEKAIKLTLDSKAVFSIHSISDWLGLAGIFEGDPYRYRINLPGTVSPGNWSLRLPLTLETLLTHAVNKKILAMNRSAKRTV